MTNTAVDEKIYDVIIVGGGITGMVTAMRCHAANLSVKVLEGRDRLGGRCLSREASLPGIKGTFDFGAHFIGLEDYQQDIGDLVKELGLKVFPQYEGPEHKFSPPPEWAGQGANLLAFWKGAGGSESDVKPYVGGLWPESYAGYPKLIALEALIGELQLIIGIDDRYGWERDAMKWMLSNKHLDNLSVEDWLREVPAATQYVIELAETLCKVGLSASAKDISMLWFVFYFASSGGIDRFTNVRFPSNGAQGYRLRDGTQSIAETIGKNLRKDDPDIVSLQTKVVGVHFSESETPNHVITDRGVFAGRRIVMALSPLLADKIPVSPALPQARHVAIKNMGHGQTVMTCIWFKEAFWRSASSPLRDGNYNGTPTSRINRYGLSGDALVVDGPIVWTMDNCSYEGAPALFAFVVTDAAKAWTGVSPAHNEANIKRALGVLYGTKEVEDNYIGMDYHNWDRDAFSMGCPAAHVKPGGFVSGMEHILLEFMPEYQNNQLFFGSSDAALFSNGYMSGAAWSGKRLAKKVIQSLQ